MTNLWNTHIYSETSIFLFGALAGVPWWIECWPANQRVTGSIPSQGTCLSCGPGPLLGACERQPHIAFSLPLFLSPFPSLKINKNLKYIYFFPLLKIKTVQMYCFHFHGPFSFCILLLPIQEIDTY